MEYMSTEATNEFERSLAEPASGTAESPDVSIVPTTRIDEHTTDSDKHSTDQFCCQHPSPLHQMTKTDARSIGTEPAPSKDETDTESFTFKPASSDAETDAESTAAEHNFSEDKTDVGLKNTSLGDPDKESVNSEAASSDDNFCKF